MQDDPHDYLYITAKRSELPPLDQEEDSLDDIVGGVIVMVLFAAIFSGGVVVGMALSWWLF